MKKILLLLLGLPVFACAQTTMDEYNYMTKGYQVQRESGLDMKRGYETKEICNSYTILNYQNRTFKFIKLIRLVDKSCCGIIVEYTMMSDKGIKTIKYFAVPQMNSSDDIWKLVRQNIFDFNNKDVGIAYSYALTELLSTNYLK
jgi:hypothetical protein